MVLLPYTQELVVPSFSQSLHQPQRQSQNIPLPLPWQCTPQPHSRIIRLSRLQNTISAQSVRREIRAPHSSSKSPNHPRMELWFAEYHSHEKVQNVIWKADEDWISQERTRKWPWCRVRGQKELSGQVRSPTRTKRYHYYQTVYKNDSDELLPKSTNR